MPSRLANCKPGWEGCGPQASYGAIVTGVPLETDLKKFSAMNSGIRMQPCDAGYPGKYPACMPTPSTMRMKYGMGAPLKCEPGGFGSPIATFGLTTFPAASTKSPYLVETWSLSFWIIEN